MFISVEFQKCQRNDHLWLHWTHFSTSGDKFKVFYNYFEKAKQLKNATKCREHTIKCSKTSKNIKKLLKYEVIHLRKEINQF